ncbi:hypothetical protein F8568_028455 [Actinomadura sp. LD22]|uniref:Uncharacterized protein n=1 Tax=Actinomadura physcomitrii TaxID=2650748 RepID=A0A6I4MN89_9ACTN|nr:hypothetical protein [Actinomadura physcomitrii]MWA04239.1 hypothetical protein [Actinomadura physcomitrii]
MTAEPAGAEWRHALPRPRPRSRPRFPWLALAGLVATVAAATTLVLGLGDTLSGPGRPRGRLLPLQAASPTASATAPATRPAPPDGRRTPDPDPVPSVSFRQALLRLRFAVGQGVAAGDVRADVGLDLNNVIRGMLAHPRHGGADIADLRHKISTRTREGAIAPGRSTELHQILSQATPP